MRTLEEVGSHSADRTSVDAQWTRPKGLPKGSPSVHLDVLRGFAAFSVLLAHWRDAFFVDYGAVPHHNPVLAAAYVVSGLGHQWVVVFFVMSGYLVGGSVLRAVDGNRWSWRSYLLARLTRLYIVLLPALLLGGAIDWAGMHMKGTQAIYNGQSGMHALPMNVYATLTLPAFLGNCLFLQTISLPGMHGRIVPLFGSNGPLWSLANEFWYYMAFPLLVLLFAKSRTFKSRAFCGLGLLILGWFVGPKIALLGIPWLMGVLITILPSLPAGQPWRRRLAVVSALGILAAGLALGKARDTLPSNLVLGVAVTILIWVTLNCATSPLSPLYVRAAHRAARSSYTLYLVHLPMLIFLKATLGLPRAIPSWHGCVLAMGVLVIILIYAQIVFELFEKNTDRIRDSIKPYLSGREAA